MKLLSLPCYCATLRQAARSVTTLYETVLADSGLHLSQYTALQVLSEPRICPRRSLPMRSASIRRLRREPWLSSRKAAWWRMRPATTAESGAGY